MPRRTLLPILLAVLAAACAAPAAHAATVVADPAAQAATALGGTIVRVSGAPGAQSLIQTDASGDRPVAGTPRAFAYRSVDLGRDRAGALVLTYVRCATPGACVVRRDDLRGHRASFTGLALTRCRLTTAPALWRTVTAYGLECRRRGSNMFDAARSGVYVKIAGRAPRRLGLPRAATQAGATSITHVDARGDRVAAVAADIYAFAFSQTTAGRGMRSLRAATSEGDGDERVTALALGTTDTLWTLTASSHAGDPNAARITRLAGGCDTWQTLTGAPADGGTDRYPAAGLAADGSSLLLVAPGTGVVTHAYAPQVGC